MLAHCGVNIGSSEKTHYPALTVGNGWPPPVFHCTELLDLLNRRIVHASSERNACIILASLIDLDDRSIMHVASYRYIHTSAADTKAERNI